MNWLLITALSCTVASTSRACTSMNPLARPLRGCATGNQVDCSHLTEGLEALFAGRSTSPDRLVAHKLSSAVLRLVRDEATTTSGDASPERRVLLVTIAQCRTGGDEACNRVANVLTGLFTGADAQLDTSADRLLAHAIASHLVALVTGANTNEIATRPADVRR
jgi:hypothetical protein